MQPFKLYSFISEPAKSPFAYNYRYIMGETFLKNINFENLSSFILEKEKEVMQEYPSTKFIETEISDGYTGLGKNSLTSRFSKYNLLKFDNEEIKKIKNQIKELHDKFLKTINIKHNFKIYIQCWANVMRKGEQIKPHIHDCSSHSYLGGHICIKTNNTNTYYINPVNQINEPVTFKSKNEVGKITFFQSYIPHYTDTYEGDEERITIAFDLFIQNKSNLSNIILLE